MKILVIGRNGQLGSSLHDLLPQRYPQSIFWDRATLDLNQIDSIQPRLEAVQPDIIINASAYTAVDQAEQETELAHAINHHGVAELAAYCQRSGAALLHVSTDYVFDGQANQPYIESDPPNPSGVYGASKLAGEQTIAASGCRHVIVRTAWVFSSYGQNFLKTMLRLGNQRNALSIVSDQIGCPTFAGDLAQALIAVVSAVEKDRCAWGLYHFAGAPAVSWFEFAETIFKEAKAAGLRTPDQLLPIATKDYPTPAPRPAWSVLSSDRFSQAFGVSASDWKTAIGQCLRS